MPARSRIDSGAATHIGRRSNNEDSFCEKPELGFFAVADGLGGHEGGEVASQLVLRTVTDFLSSDERTAPSAPVPSAESEPAAAGPERLLREAVQLAHHEVRAQQKGKLHMMASTLTAVLFEQDEAVVCNLGDSRTFLVRDGAVQRLTKDHTVLAEMEAAGLDTKTPFALRHRNSLTGAVGMEDSVDVDCGRVSVRPGDVLLLCSDGLYEPVPPDLMVELLAQGGSAREMAERLVTRAYDRGGTDNITGIVLRVL
ncbi:PP2C family protein-serine/threonine phosphatase [Melittangium boletus]|uniref:Serine/threonine protein phosphatase n=1 Tax=Melittangium boletus DSM 14713 TaxID=1294270 RepID=A0A250IGT5_9BACT|nr:protein phosphatase 2C domain-containing protein [Melittangium boletus]ATB30372.1 serine/threonine protein phosphatase [Melittangium boletus DSM 14713]